MKNDLTLLGIFCTLFRFYKSPLTHIPQHSMSTRSKCNIYGFLKSCMNLEKNKKNGLKSGSHWPFANPLPQGSYCHVIAYEPEQGLSSFGFVPHVEVGYVGLYKEQYSIRFCIKGVWMVVSFFCHILQHQNSKSKSIHNWVNGLFVHSNLSCNRYQVWLTSIIAYVQK